MLLATIYSLDFWSFTFSSFLSFFCSLRHHSFEFQNQSLQSSKFISFNKAISILSNVMSSSSKPKGKHGGHHHKSRHHGHHASSRRPEEQGESSRRAHREDTGAGREFGPNWRTDYRPGSDESSADRGRNRLRQEEYPGYYVPPSSPRPRGRPRESMWGDAARASLELVQTQDRQARARNSWREGREAARDRGEPVDDRRSPCCVIL